MSEVKLNLTNNYGFYQQENNSKPSVQEEAAKQEAPKTEVKSVAPDKMLDALSFMGAQNMVQVSGKMPVEPAKYLSSDRISSIEDMMAVFEAGVEKYAAAVKAEFGSISDSAAYALAANAFASSEA